METKVEGAGTSISVGVSLFNSIGALPRNVLTTRWMLLGNLAGDNTPSASIAKVENSALTADRDIKVVATNEMDLDAKISSSSMTTSLSLSDNVAVTVACGGFEPRVEQRRRPAVEFVSRCRRLDPSGGSRQRHGGRWKTRTRQYLWLLALGKLRPTASRPRLLAISCARMSMRRSTVRTSLSPVSALGQIDVTGRSPELYRFSHQRGRCICSAGCFQQCLRRVCGRCCCDQPSAGQNDSQHSGFGLEFPCR